jgi:uncharacterized membrane protein (DUF4010 family)
LLTVTFSLLIGLEQRRKQNLEDPMHTFGTDRTFTLIGILGFVLYIISPATFIPFLCGLLFLFIFLGIYYYKKISNYNRYGITAIITALVTYCLAPLIYTQPQYIVLMIVVCLLIVTEIKENLSQISKKFDNTEFITLAKFLVLAGVILPLLPHTPIAKGFTITAYNFWLSVVVVSAISYLSYLLQKFVFPHSGLLLTGLLGGLYSSTATTIILSRKSKENPGNHRIVPAMLLAIAMMYFRIFLLALFFNQKIAMLLFPYFLILFLLSLLLAFFSWRYHKRLQDKNDIEELPTDARNPLEFKTAFIFGLLFVLFTVVTHYVLRFYGTNGLHSVALVVGVTDIDPFILNLLQGKWQIDDSVLSAAILLAINSNNIAKFSYAVLLSDKTIKRPLYIGFISLILLGFILYFLKPF